MVYLWHGVLDKPEWFVILPLISSLLCWTIKLLFVLFDWYKLWFADKLVKYWVDDGEDDEDADWSEIIIGVTFWAYGWLNVITSFWFSISAIESQIEQYKDLFYTAIYSLSDAALESVFKIFFDAYGFAKSQEKSDALCSGWSIWAWYVEKYDYVGERYRTVIVPTADKYITIINEIPQIAITWYHLSKGGWEDTAGTVSISWGTSMLIVQFLIYWIIDTYVQQNIEFLKKARKAYKKYQRAAQRANWNMGCL